MIRFSHSRGFSENQTDTGSNKGVEMSRMQRPGTPFPIQNPKRQWGSMEEGSALGTQNSPEPLSDYISTMDSPGAEEQDSKGMQAQNSDGIQERDTQGGGATNEDVGWASFVENTGLDGSSNLPDYLSAKSAREAAKANFMRALDECSSGLRQAMVEEMLRDSVVAIYQEQGECFEAQESDVISTMNSNHTRRKAMLKCMDEADSTWSKTYRRLRGTINREEIQKESNGIYEESQPDSTGEAGSPVVKENQEGGEPNWGELAQFEPSRDNIQSFLDARGRFHNVEESLKQSLDEIHAGLEAEASAILNVAVGIHDDHEARCMELEQDIQYYLMENNRRQEALQKSLEESAKQAQGVFASLLTRLSTKKP